MSFRRDSNNPNPISTASSNIARLTINNLVGIGQESQSTERLNSFCTKMSGCTTQANIDARGKEGRKRRKQKRMQEEAKNLTPSNNASMDTKLSESVLATTIDCDKLQRMIERAPQYFGLKKKAEELTKILKIMHINLCSNELVKTSSAISKDEPPLLTLTQIQENPAVMLQNLKKYNPINLLDNVTTILKRSINRKTKTEMIMATVLVAAIIIGMIIETIDTQPYKVEEEEEDPILSNNVSIPLEMKPSYNDMLFIIGTIASMLANTIPR